jgi:hypothetical protein
MSRQWGGATTNTQPITMAVSVGASLRTALITMWVKPTTLTAGRTLWAAATNTRIEIDTTTSELRIRTDNTTDGQWTTTGVNLVVDEWTFIAVYLSAFNTNGAEIRVWRGNLMEAPTEVTVTVAVARSGNFTGSTTTAVGNTASGSVSFQGDIEDYAIMVSTGIEVFKVLTAHGAALDQDAVDWIRQYFIVPVWQGDWTPWMQLGVDNSNNTQVYRSPLADDSLTIGPRVVTWGWVYVQVMPSQPPSINGAATTRERCPRPAELPQYGSRFLPGRR